MVNVYITGKFLDNVRYLPILFPHLGPLKNEKRLFSDKGYLSFKEPAFNLVSDLQKADFILLPHEYFDVLKTDLAFLDEHTRLSQESGKKLLIFDLSDYTDKEINVSNAFVFRIAGYSHNRRENEIIMGHGLGQVAQCILGSLPPAFACQSTGTDRDERLLDIVGPISL